MDYQKILLIGNTTDAAKVGKPEDKLAYADFTVAVSRSREETDFFPVRVFGELAERAGKLDKGAQVLVEGRVEIGRFTPPDGNPQKTIRVVADTLRVIPNRVGVAEGQ